MPICIIYVLLTKNVKTHVILSPLNNFFFFSILRRLVIQTSKQAHLEAECEASQKQAKQANAAAQLLLDQQDNTSNKVSYSLIMVIKLYSILIERMLSTSEIYFPKARL